MSLGTQLAETSRGQRRDEQRPCFVRSLYGVFGWFGSLRCSVGIRCPGGGFVQKSPGLVFGCWMIRGLRFSVSCL